MLNHTQDSTLCSLLAFFFPKKGQKFANFCVCYQACIFFIFGFFMSFLVVSFLYELQYINIIWIFFNKESVNRKGYLSFWNCQCIPTFLYIFFSPKFELLIKFTATFCLRRVFFAASLELLGLKQPYPILKF